MYPTLDIVTLLANPEAHLANKRFIDTDLNREFHYDNLCCLDDDDNDDDNDGEDESKIIENDALNNDNDNDVDSIESRRAKELDDILGSKCDEARDEFDVAIDLHSTTSNMGITLIINEGDELMTQGAAYVAHKCKGARILMHSIPEREERRTLSSAAKHGFTVEVGPVPQGILRHDAVQKTESAMHSLLDFLQRKNEGHDDVLQELKTVYPTGTVPCFRTAPAKRPGEISGKLTWPCDPDNPNFPSLMVHESIQDNDFSLLKVGDPLFVAPDRSIINYDGSHGDEVYVVFVNEAGYYYSSSGTGIGVAISSKYNVETGLLHHEEKREEEEESEETRESVV